MLARAAPADRLVRHHAWQGGILAVAAWLAFLTLGLGPTAPVAAILAGLVLAAVLVGATGATMGRFVRVRPLSDVARALTAQSRRRNRGS